MLSNDKSLILEFKKGFTLIELLIVIFIVSIFAVIVIPRINLYIDKAKEIELESNCKTIESHYQLYLVKKNIHHSDLLLTQFLDENYPAFSFDIDVTYIDNILFCDEKENNDIEVPFLSLDIHNDVSMVKG